MNTSPHYLSYLSTIKVAGSDAKTFLQGQVSCDMEKITPTQSQLGVYCNPQGRVIAGFRISQVEQDYHLCLPKDSIPLTIERLSKYARFSKVSLSEINLQYIGVSGEHIDNIIQNTLECTPPQKTNTSLYHKNILIQRLSGKISRFLLSTESDTVLPEKILQAGMDDASWQLLEIENGIPAIYHSIQEHFLPHRLNYHLIGGLDFSKGCYVGQEIIARLHYRGRLKHHMYHLQLKTEKTLLPAEKITNQNGNLIGEIVNFCSFSTESKHILAVLQIDKFNKNCLNFSEKKIKYQLLDLPYKLNYS